MEPVTSRVEKLVRDGVFGEGELIQVVNESDEGKGAQFGSESTFLRVEVRNGSGETQKIPVIVKTQVENEAHRARMLMDAQFANEVAMYDQVLPTLGATKLGLCPKMYYGFATDGKEPERDILILNDLRPDDYKIAKGLSLDFDHLALTLKKLGEYHGLSYKLKKSSPETVRSLADSLRPINYIIEDEVMRAAIARGFRLLLEKNPSSPILNKAHSRLMSQSHTISRKELKKPEEPFALILHGDVNKNNILYKYDDDGKVVDLKFLDFGSAEYSDPTVDLTFFLYMNSTDEIRSKHWDELLEIYWKGVTSVEIDPGFTFEQFLDNFAKKAVYGYLPTCFFLPVLMTPREELMAARESKGKVELGGERATEAVSKIAHYIFEKGYLENYIQHFD